MEEQNNALGLVAAVLATAFYGSCYVPVRWFEAGDGSYFQWLMCIGQFVSGVVVLAFVGWPPVSPLAMLGGAFFALGNALTITIMDGIGMAVGSLLWNTVTCIVGWAVSRFGLFGSLKKVPCDNLMNIIGVIIVCIGGCFFATLKHHPMKVRPAPWQFQTKLPQNQKDLEKDGEVEISRSRRIFAILCTIFVGCLYGNMLTPVSYEITRGSIAGKKLHYETFFFSFSVGALVTSTIITMLYSAYRRNRPFINPEITLPSLISGLMYGAATYFFFIASEHLDPIVAYPILAKAPGIVCAIWAIVLFKEIKGRWDFTHLIVGIIVTVTGITLITVSKITTFF
ncbi:hypothetical protein OESDEN_08221 [Oesophagostomum dentatum]|uniref:Transmembrane protein 144 n=1 Tax=Oesophagostomum dentatum TaxID=61180 RepID=A0A0B1T7W6_OESDE|nr:hypothetical protein OESDEN_08221 [Oesophagostomum dentatum]